MNVQPGDMCWLDNWTPPGTSSKTGHTRVAAKVVTLNGDGSAVVAPEWGELCPTCALKPEHGRGARPKKVTVPAGGSAEAGELALSRMDETNAQGRADMMELADLAVGELMYNLRLRYKASPMQFYTYVGDILIVVNPMADMGVTGEQDKIAYTNVPFRDPAVSPHIYAVAEAAFQQLGEEGAPQVIVISGESGAGKTYATNDVLDYLAFRGAGPQGSSDIVSKITAISGIIEALGNAKTSRNHNSSRFGKLVKVQFDEDGVIEGAALQTYLLEKSRIVGQQPGERNYHIFYLMFQFLEPDELTSRGLSTSVEDYPYLVGTDGVNADSWRYMPYDPRSAAAHAAREPMEDKLRWADWVAAVDALGLQDEMSHVWDVLAAILIIGTLQFAEDDAVTGAEFCVVSPPGALDTVARLLGVSADDLGLNLLSCKVMSTRRAYRADKAKQTADALAKLLYASLFDYMIEDINSKIKTGFTRKWIGVLDIFGFESFQSLPGPKGVPDTQNYFEQLCINLTNERLQRFFYDQLIPKQLAHYEDHGLDVEAIDYADNTACVDLIMEGRSSLFAALNNATKEAATLPAFRNDPHLAELRWVETIKKKYKGGNGRMTMPIGEPRASKDEFVGWFDDRLDDRANTSFAVHHYAETVWYSVSGCVDKNADKIDSEMLKVVMASDSDFVCTLFDPDTLDLSTSVADKFAEQLRALVSPASWQVPGHPSGMLDLAAAPFFVRCVKPICSREPSMPSAPLSNHKVLDQLRSAGMYAIIQMRLAGYASEIRKDAFVDTYFELVEDRAKFKLLGLDDQVRWLCMRVIDTTDHDLSNEQGMPPFQVGTGDLVFLKDNMAYAMRDALSDAIAAKTFKMIGASRQLRALYDMWATRQELPRLQATYAENQERLEFLKARMAEGASRDAAQRAWEAELESRAAAREAEFKTLHLAPLQKKAESSPAAQLLANLDTMIAAEPQGPERDAMASRRAALDNAVHEVAGALAAFDMDVFDESLEDTALAALAALDALVRAEHVAAAEDVARQEAAAAAAAEAEYIAVHVTSVVNAGAAVPLNKARGAMDVFKRRHAATLAKRDNLSSALHAHLTSLDEAAAVFDARVQELQADPHDEEAQAAAAAALSSLEVLVGGVPEFLRLMDEQVEAAAVAEAAKEKRREARARKRAEREQRKAELMAARQAMLSAKEQEAARRAEEAKKRAEMKKRAVKVLKKKQARRLKWYAAASEAMKGTRVLFHHAEATLQFLGPLPDPSVNLLNAPYYLGLEMPYPSDCFNSGDYHGQLLFDTLPQHGIFVSQSLVSVLVANDELRAGERHLQVGDRVWRRHHVPLQTGTIQYYGETHFDEGQWVGLALDQVGTGDNAGRVHGFRYFQCGKNCGLFVRPDELERIEPWSHAIVKEKTNEYLVLNDIYLDDSDDDDDDDGYSSDDYDGDADKLFAMANASTPSSALGRPAPRPVKPSASMSEIPSPATSSPASAARMHGRSSTQRRIRTRNPRRR